MASKGQDELLAYLRKLVPSQQIVFEYHIGSRLRLDMYLPSYKLGVEYHGIQHFEFNDHFYKTQYDFKEAQRRDILKEELCKELGIRLVIFRYDDILSYNMVAERVLTAIESTEVAIEPKGSWSKTNTHWYQEQKDRNNEYRRKLYRELKNKYK